VSGLLEGRVAVVTGGARGIGRAIAAALSAQGARGMILDLEPAIEGAAPPQGFLFHPADVTREAELRSAFTSAVERFGRLDVVAANAGVVPPWRQPEGLDIEEWGRVFATNVGGLASTIKHAVPLIGRGGGSIVVTVSVNALRAPPSQMAYTASKSALVGLIRTAALDLGARGIRVNGVAPGTVMTDALVTRIKRRQAEGGPERAVVESETRARTPLRALAIESDVANAAVFLSSDWAARITGHILPIDGGYGIA